MSGGVASNPIEEWANYLTANLGDPWDWASFGWGMLAGFIATVAVGGVVLYYTWPDLLSLTEGIVGAENVRQAVRKVLSG